MRHATSYQHCHDADRERDSLLAEIHEHAEARRVAEIEADAGLMAQLRDEAAEWFGDAFTDADLRDVVLRHIAHEDAEAERARQTRVGASFRRWEAARAAA